MNLQFVTMPADLLAAMLEVLENQPARVTRGILNAVEQVIKQQAEELTKAEKEVAVKKDAEAKEVITKE